MNAAEALAITRFVRAACPGQKFDEYTADVWGELLADADYQDARAAVGTLAKRQPFIAAPEILTEVKRIRADRLARYGNSEPDYDGSDVQAGLEAIRRHRALVAAGEVRAVPPQINGPRSADLAKLLDDTVDRLPRVPSAFPELNKRG